MSPVREDPGATVAPSYAGFSPTSYVESWAVCCGRRYEVPAEEWSEAPACVYHLGPLSVGPPGMALMTEMLAWGDIPEKEEA